MRDEPHVVYPVSYTHLEVYKRQPFGQRIRIADGAQLEPGDILTEGFAYPQDILAIKGPIACLLYTSRCV